MGFDEEYILTSRIVISEMANKGIAVVSETCIPVVRLPYTWSGN